MTISNIAVQVYGHVFATQFRDTPHSQALIARRWDLLLPQAFLCTLGHAPEAIRGGLKLALADMELFRTLVTHISQVIAALAAFKTRSKTGI